MNKILVLKEAVSENESWQIVMFISTNFLAQLFVGNEEHQEGTNNECRASGGWSWTEVE